MNHALFKDYHKHQLEKMVPELEYFLKQMVATVVNNLRLESNSFRYVGYRELTPEDRVAVLRSTTRKKWERRYDINQTNKHCLVFQFVLDGEILEMMCDLPYIDDFCIMRYGTPYYPIFAITDQGGLCSMRENRILLKVARARLIFQRHFIRSVPTTDGENICEFSITAKINQSSKGKSEYPPIVLHHLSLMGFKRTMQLYGVDDCLSIIQADIPPELKDFKFVSIGNQCYIQINMKTLTTDAKRVLVGLYEVYTYYPNFSYPGVLEEEYYVIVTGKWSDESQTYEPYLYGNAKNYLNMNETLIDEPSRLAHNSTGVMYNTLEELMLFMFKNIDKLMSDQETRRLDMFRKKLSGCDLILEELVKAINYRMLGVLNSRNSNRTPNIKSLIKPVSYVPAITKTWVFRTAPTFLSANRLAVAALRFNALTSADVSGKRKSKKAQTSPDLLVFHHSNLSTISIMTYPSSSPIVSGSLNPFIVVDDHSNIKEPYFIDELKTMYAKKQQ